MVQLRTLSGCHAWGVVVVLHFGCVRVWVNLRAVSDVSIVLFLCRRITKERMKQIRDAAKPEEKRLKCVPPTTNKIVVTLIENST